MTLTEEVAAWRERLKSAAEPCPACGHLPQLRRHKFTSTMALALIHQYHKGAPIAARAIPPRLSTGGTLVKLVLWGLVRVSGGQCELTREGLDTVLERRSLYRECVAAHGVPMWWDGDLVTLRQTLDQRWSYEDLMASDEEVL